VPLSVCVLCALISIGAGCQFKSPICSSATSGVRQNFTSQHWTQYRDRSFVFRYLFPCSVVNVYVCLIKCISFLLFNSFSCCISIGQVSAFNSANIVLVKIFVEVNFVKKVTSRYLPVWLLLMSPNDVVN